MFKKYLNFIVFHFVWRFYIKFTFLLSLENVIKFKTIKAILLIVYYSLFYRQKNNLPCKSSIRNFIINKNHG